jgi:hypothetical protein
MAYTGHTKSICTRGAAVQGLLANANAQMPMPFNAQLRCWLLAAARHVLA